MKLLNSKVAKLVAPLDGPVFYQALSSIIFFVGGAIILSLLSPQFSIIIPYFRMSFFVFGLFVSIIAAMNYISTKYAKKLCCYGLELLISIAMLIAISYLPKAIIDTLISAFVLFMATIIIIKILFEFRSFIYFLMPSLIILILACLAVLKYLSYNFVTPLFVERLLLTGVHLDTLFHASLSNILNNYSTLSLGINGLDVHRGYFFAEYLYGRLAIIGGVDVLEFYNYGTILVILPLFFMIFCVSVGKYSLKPKLAITGVKEILIATIVFFLLIYSPFPLEFFRSIGLFGGSSIASESQLVALIFVTIAVQNLWAMHQKIGSGEEGIYFHGIVLLVLLAILTITKTPAVLHLSVFLVSYFLINFLYTRKFKFLLFGITPLFFLIGVLNTVEQVQVSFPFEERFLYFQYQYIRGAWPLLLFFLVIIPTISYCLIRSGDFSGAPSRERFFRGAALGIGASLFIVGIFPFVGLIWRVGEHFGSLEYFWDYAIFIPSLIFTYIILNKLPSGKGSFGGITKSLPLPIIAVFGLALIFKISDVISVSKNALWLQVNTINQVLVKSSSPINPDDICTVNSDSCLEKSFESLKNIRCLKEFYPLCL